MVKLRCCLGSKYIRNNWGSWWQWCTWEGGQVPRCKLNHLVTAPGIILKANTSVPFLIWPHRAWPMDAQLLNQQKAKRYHPNSYMYNCIINSCCKIIITLFDLVFRKKVYKHKYININRLSLPKKVYVVWLSFFKQGLLVAGGYGNGVGMLSSTEIYLPSKNNWTRAGELPRGTSYHYLNHFQKHLYISLREAINCEKKIFCETTS